MIIFYKSSVEACFSNTVISEYHGATQYTHIGARSKITAASKRRDEPSASILDRFKVNTKRIKAIAVTNIKRLNFIQRRYTATAEKQ